MTGRLPAGTATGGDAAGDTFGGVEGTDCSALAGAQTGNANANG